MLDISFEIIKEMPAYDPHEKVDGWIYLIRLDTDIPYIYDADNGKKVYPYYVGKSHSITRRIKSHMMEMESPFNKEQTKLYRYCSRFMRGEFDAKKVHFYILAEGKYTRDELIDLEADFIIKYKAAKQGMNTSDPEVDYGEEN